MTIELEKQFIIAGPCAAESRAAVIGCAQEIKEHVQAFRASLWKPRTQPGFDGIGISGIPWLKEVAELGLTVATEVLSPEQAEQFIVSLIEPSSSSAEFIFWFGSRNQCHFTQSDIAGSLKDIQNVRLMIKNQPWEDENHWLGIVEHVLKTGFPQERLILCHRGFFPTRQRNPNKFRNFPNWEMAMHVKELTGIPMLFDPSHIGGTTENVFRATRQAKKFDFDGMMVEVHPKPEAALTDSRQQLDIPAFKKLIKVIGEK